MGMLVVAKSKKLQQFTILMQKLKVIAFLVKQTQNTDDPYFGKSSTTLEGGFFGGKAQELAGKFLADDKSVFVVFAGKRDADAKKDDSESAFDAFKIKLKDLNKSEMDTFGNATHLIINNKQIPLIAEGKKSFAEMKFDDLVTRTIDGKTYRVSVCCNNLDYVKFGTYREEIIVILLTNI